MIELVGFRVDMTNLKSNPDSSSLASAYQLGISAQKFGLDWQEISQVIYKVEEEWQELKEELKPGISPCSKRIEEEMGDFLFSAAQLARHLGVDPEVALEKANKKFVQRVEKVEKAILADGKTWEELSFDQIDVYWEEAKKRET